jgi:hypothetical protein
MKVDNMEWNGRRIDSMALPAPAVDQGQRILGLNLQDNSPINFASWDPPFHFGQNIFSPPLCQSNKENQKQRCMGS